MATAIACILDLEISDVPDFEEMGKFWSWKLMKWLKSIGYYIEAQNIKKWVDGNRTIFDLPKDLCLVSGDSPRGDFKHMVIFENHLMIHDPHPSNAGIKSFDDFWIIRKISDDKQEGLWYGYTYDEMWGMWDEAEMELNLYK